MVTNPPSESKYFVFLLGAGFSTPLGPPVMKAFMGRARRNYHKLATENASDLVPDYERMLLFQQECLHGSGWIFNRDWENIEEVYTQADLLRLAQSPDPDVAQTLCDDIAWSIWDVYRKSDSISGIPECTVLQSVLYQLQKEGLQPVIITTNYDVILEKLITLYDSGSHHNKPADLSKWRYYYPGFQVPGDPPQILLKAKDEEPSGQNWLPIIKLHGSANWFSIKRQPAETPADDWVALTTVEPLSLPAVDKAHVKGQLIGLERNFQDRLLSPAIIPPMLGKASIMPVIASQWRAAMKFLKGARKLWIVGYSFPSTDTFLPRLLCEGMKDNQDLDQVVIANIDDLIQWNDRINSLFTPSITQTKIGYMRLDPTAQFLRQGFRHDGIVSRGIEFNLGRPQRGGFITQQI